MKYNSLKFLILVYTLSHLLLVLISGQWWDDWIIWLNPVNEIKCLFCEMGLPWEAYNLFSVMWLPNWGYRIVVFFLFMLSGLLFYLILRQLHFFSREDAFWIAAIALTAPVNDARATIICYGYSLSLALFLLAFYMVTQLDKYTGIKMYALRILSLCFLIYSYTTESLLVFTGLIWLYLNYIVWKDNDAANLNKKIRLFIKNYWDYFAIPFAFFIVKNLLWKPYARYLNYNTVTLKSLIKGALLSPFVSLKTVAIICQSYFKQLGILSVIISLIIFALYFFSKKGLLIKENIEAFSIRKKYILYFIIGVIVFYAGIFAYIIVRGGKTIQNIGVGGRDAMLLGFGIAIMAVAFSRFLPVKKSMQNIIPLLLIILGIFHFNNWYLNYQEDWYHQKEFAYAIEDNNGFVDDDTILCVFLSESPINGTRFYSLNGMSYAVTGEKNKFFFSGIRDLQYCAYNEDFIFDYMKGYIADDYNFSDMTVDGVLFLNNEPISNLRLLQIRFNEIFAPEKYKEDIQRLTAYSYIPITPQKSEQLFELYLNNELTLYSLKELTEYDK